MLDWNDKRIQKLNEQLNDLSKKYSVAKTQISALGGYDNKIYSVSICFPLKGSKAFITALLRTGWKCIRRTKRSNSIWQEMQYYFTYEKYAIYKTKLGLRAVTYVDTISEAKNYFGINPNNLPVLVNRCGGHCSFIEELERKAGFMYIVEVAEGDFPLTREQQYPKNSEKFHWGWIDPEGNTYACSFEAHSAAAEAICKENEFDTYNEEHYLEEHGWLRISRKAPYTPDNANSRMVYMSEYHLTKKQKETLIDLGLHNNWEVKQLMKE